MAKTWKMPFTPAKDGDKLNASYLDDVGVITLVGDNNIAVYIGDNVPLYPDVTIEEGWKWLFDGVSSRNLLDGPFNAFDVYSGSNWEIMTANDRRTESLLATLTEDDIMIGIGALASATGDSVMMHAAFKQLIEFAAESNIIG